MTAPKRSDLAQGKRKSLQDAVRELTELIDHAVTTSGEERRRLTREIELKADEVSSWIAMIKGFAIMAQGQVA